MNEAHMKFCASPEWRQIVEERILPDALQDVDLGHDIIEIGPGPGFTTDVLRRLSDRVTAVEVDPDLAGTLEAQAGGHERRGRAGRRRRLGLSGRSV